MSQVFGFGVPAPQPTIPPPVPRKQDSAVTQAGNAELRNRGREGRASTFITSLLTKPRSTTKDEQQTLGGYRT